MCESFNCGRLGMKKFFYTSGLVDRNRGLNPDTHIALSRVVC
jgi:hypothetical protein